MTPAAQRDVLLFGTLHPRDPVAVADRITWQTVWDRPPTSWPGTAQLLDHFSDLERADPDEMAEFVGRYGAPEVKGADLTVTGSLSVIHLRRYARGLAAARRVGAALVTRRPGAGKDWVAMQLMGDETWVEPADEWDDWKLGRERYARWLTHRFASTRVGLHADWLGLRGLALEPSAGSLLGLVVVLLAREVGAEGEYECSACGARVQRVRPPRAGERVYCDRAECKREQQRRNQAKWRAKKKGGGES